MMKYRLTWSDTRSCGRVSVFSPQQTSVREESSWLFLNFHQVDVMIRSTEHCQESSHLSSPGWFGRYYHMAISRHRGRWWRRVSWLMTMRLSPCWSGLWDCHYSTWYLVHGINHKVGESPRHWYLPDISDGCFPARRNHSKYYIVSQSLSLFCFVI